MSNSKHTPGPWIIDSKVVKGSINSGPKHIAMVNFWNNGKQSPDTVDEEEHNANAARIVSCVNSMEGIADPAKLREVFDELVAALKNNKLCEHCEGHGFHEEPESYQNEWGAQGQAEFDCICTISRKALISKAESLRI